MYIKHTQFNEDTEAGRYLLACARIRNCSPTALVRRLIETVIRDQLVLSILDDDSKPAEHRKGEHGFHARIG